MRVPSHVEISGDRSSNVCGVRTTRPNTPPLTTAFVEGVWRDLSTVTKARLEGVVPVAVAQNLAPSATGVPIT